MKRPSSSLLVQTVWMLWGFGVRLGIQVVYFVLVARTLGPEGYGSFVSVLAIVAILVPFASWGSGNILVKHASRDPSRFQPYWGAALAVTLVSGSLLTGLALAITALVFSVHEALYLALPIALGDLIGLRLADVASQAFQSQEKLNRTAAVWVLMSLLRLASALLLFTLEVPKTPEAWALLYSLSGLVAGGANVVWVFRELGRGPLSLIPFKGEWREGFFFALGLAAQGAYNELDKTLLGRLGTPQAAGQYAAAYRVLDAAFIPMRALLYASYPRFFQEGARGTRATHRFALRLLPVGLGVGVIGGLFLLGVAPFLPKLLGEEYAHAAEILPFLAPIILLRTLHYLAADGLTGAGYQGLRSGVQIGVAVFNLGLNLWLIPLWGVWGAVWSSLVSNGFLAIALWLALAVLRRKVTWQGEKTH